MRYSSLVAPLILPGVLLSACAGDQPLAPDDPGGAAGRAVVPVAAAARGGPAAMLRVRTYDGSGQSVHPDVVYFPTGWHGFEYWMAYTPYPDGQESFENPSLAVSHDGKSWQAPPGLTNPVIQRPIESNGYNSDPDLRYDPASDRLQMIFRQVRRGHNLVRLTTSADGVRWSRPRPVLTRPNHELISPTVAFGPAGQPRIWYVDAGSRPCQRRVTRVMTQLGTAAALTASGSSADWGPRETTDLVQPGYYVWHIDVIYVSEKQEYWAAYPAYREGDCGPRELFFATSGDGIHWRTFAVPLLRHEEQRWTGGTLYRASLLYDRGRDVVRVFLSGADTRRRWHLGYVEYPYRGLLSRLEAATNAPLALQRTPAQAGGTLEDR